MNSIQLQTIKTNVTYKLMLIGNDKSFYMNNLNDCLLTANSQLILSTNDTLS